MNDKKFIELNIKTNLCMPYLLEIKDLKEKIKNIKEKKERKKLREKIKKLKEVIEKINSCKIRESIFSKIKKLEDSIRWAEEYIPFRKKLIKNEFSKYMSKKELYNEWRALKRVENDFKKEKKLLKKLKKKIKGKNLNENKITIDFKKKVIYV